MRTITIEWDTKEPSSGNIGIRISKILKQYKEELIYHDYTVYSHKGHIVMFDDMLLGHYILHGDKEFIYKVREGIEKEGIVVAIDVFDCYDRVVIEKITKIKKIIAEGTYP